MCISLHPHKLQVAEAALRLVAVLAPLAVVVQLVPAVVAVPVGVAVPVLDSESPQLRMNPAAVVPAAVTAHLEPCSPPRAMRRCSVTVPLDQCD